MIVHYIILLLWSLLVLASTNNDEHFTQAVIGLEQLARNFTRPNVYNIDNIEGNLYIPQFDQLTNDYKSKQEKPQPPLELTRRIIPLLKKSASESRNVNALVTLGDLYLFGNYSLTPDYYMAKEYYQEAISLAPNGHAYFMLGYIYSTGLFGTFPVDQERGVLYYQFAVENGDRNAQMVMAYKNFKGLGVPKNCELALEYYTDLVEQGKDWMSRNDADGQVDYNIRISDFNGGLYGEKMSETTSTIEIRSKYFKDLRNSFEEYKLTANEHEYATLFYNALESYKGDYFVPKNLTKAFLTFQECVDLGEEIYGASDYKNIDGIDKMFLSSCQSKLGRMYLKGMGVSNNTKKAKQILDRSLKVQGTPEALNLLGFIEDQGLLGEPNVTKAVDYYVAAIKKKSSEANRNLAKLLMRMNGGDPHTSEHHKEIYTYMKDAVYHRDTEALYYMGSFLQSGLSKIADSKNDISCPNIVMYYRVFLERLSSFYAPHLKFAFEELIAGNYQNALIGYLIAAEHGFEEAQISAAYLLYQLQPLYSKQPPKTFVPERVEMAVDYLERASKQSNVDATILLGDLYSGQAGASHITPDFDRAFNYYRTAAERESSHGAYKLAEMYEYGIGPANNSVDYFMAKRYYDFSLKYNEMLNHAKLESPSQFVSGKTHIDWALLRLRLKYLFNRLASKQSGNSDGGWLSAFKKVGNRVPNEVPQDSNSISRANAHHEGGTYNDDLIEEYDIGDYLVIAMTFIFFFVFFVQNILRQFRRMRNGQRRDEANNNNNNGDDNDDNQGQNGWNGNQFHFRRGNFEFHFFAI